MQTTGAQGKGCVFGVWRCTGACCCCRHRRLLLLLLPPTGSLSEQCEGEYVVRCGLMGAVLVVLLLLLLLSQGGC